MPVSDLDIYRAAHQWIAQHGDNATAMARQIVEFGTKATLRALTLDCASSSPSGRSEHRQQRRCCCY